MIELQKIKNVRRQRILLVKKITNDCFGIVTDFLCNAHIGSVGSLARATSSDCIVNSEEKTYIHVIMHSQTN